MAAGIPDAFFTNRDRAKYIDEETDVPKASDLKRGMVVDINDAPHIVRQVEAKSPSSRGASTLYKIRLNNLRTKQKLDMSFKGDDHIKDADCKRMSVQYSFQDGDSYHFMNLEDFSQYELNSADLDGQLGYLTEGLEGVLALLLDDQILSVELPQSVDLEIVETTPGVKGSTATGRTKPARLSTGIEVQVPEYLENGEVIKVNTVTGKFMSRA